MLSIESGNPMQMFFIHGNYFLQIEKCFFYTTQIKPFVK